VGPLFTKRGDRVKVYLDFWIWFGTPGPLGPGARVINYILYYQGLRLLSTSFITFVL